ncbi:MAG: hypothetical protein ACYC3V_02490 [Chloroflexota bacterium]
MDPQMSRMTQMDTLWMGIQYSTKVMGTVMLSEAKHLSTDWRSFAGAQDDGWACLERKF